MTMTTKLDIGPSTGQNRAIPTAKFFSFSLFLSHDLISLTGLAFLFTLNPISISFSLIFFPLFFSPSVHQRQSDATWWIKHFDRINPLSSVYSRPSTSTKSTPSTNDLVENAKTDLIYFSNLVLITIPSLLVNLPFNNPKKTTRKMKIKKSISISIDWL